VTSCSLPSWRESSLPSVPPRELWVSGHPEEINKLLSKAAATIPPTGVSGPAPPAPPSIPAGATSPGRRRLGRLLAGLIALGGHRPSPSEGPAGRRPHTTNSLDLTPRSLTFITLIHRVRVAHHDANRAISLLGADRFPSASFSFGARPGSAGSFTFGSRYFILAVAAGGSELLSLSVNGGGGRTPARRLLSWRCGSRYGFPSGQATRSILYVRSPTLFSGRSCPGGRQEVRVFGWRRRWSRLPLRSVACYLG